MRSPLIISALTAVVLLMGGGCMGLIDALDKNGGDSPDMYSQGWDAPDQLCIGECSGKECGDDGCGGTCGACPDGISCQAFHCGPPVHVWSKSFGSEHSETAGVLAVDGNGNLYVTVEFAYSGLDFGDGALQNTGGYDEAIVKLNPAGEVIWTRQIGGKYDEWIDSLVADRTGNIYLKGHSGSKSIKFGSDRTVENATEGGAFLASYDPSGKLTLASGLPSGQGSTSTAISLDKNGDAFLATLPSKNGWRLCISPFGSTVATDESWCILQGFYKGIWDVKPDRKGGFVMLVSETQGGIGDDRELTVLNFVPEQGVSWSAKLGLEDDYLGSYSMDTDADGNTYIVGLFEDAVVAPDQAPDEDDWEDPWGEYLVKVDSVGGIAWALEISDYDGAGDFRIQVCVDGAGNALVGANGYFGEVPSGYDLLEGVFVLKVGSDGKVVWARNFENPAGWNYADGIVSDQEQHFYLAGSTTGGLDFGGGILPERGSYDMFLVKFGE